MVVTKYIEIQHKSVFNFSFFDFYSRISLVDAVGFHIASGNTAYAQHGVGVGCYPLTDDASCSNPRPFLNVNAFHHQVEMAFLVVVVAAEQKDPL